MHAATTTMHKTKHEAHKMHPQTQIQQRCATQPASVRVLSSYSCVNAEVLCFLSMDSAYRFIERTVDECTVQKAEPVFFCWSQLTTLQDLLPFAPAACFSGFGLSFCWRVGGSSSPSPSTQKFIVIVDDGEWNKQPLQCAGS